MAPSEAELIGSNSAPKAGCTHVLVSLAHTDWTRDCLVSQLPTLKISTTRASLKFTPIVTTLFTLAYMSTLE